MKLLGFIADHPTPKISDQRERVLHTPLTVGIIKA